MRNVNGVFIDEEIKKVRNSKRTNIDVENYIFSSIENLEIEITGSEKRSARDLIDAEKLDGWCFETTEAMVVFFDTAYIVRGFLNYKGGKYNHAWLEILYQGELFIFDPALNIICLKNEYDKVFNPYLKSSLSSSIIRDALIKVLEGEIEPYVPHFDEETNIKVMEFGNFLKRMAIDYGKKVPYSTDLLAPFYLNNSAYIGNVEDNKIKSLRVHFYDNEA